MQEKNKNIGLRFRSKNKKGNSAHYYITKNREIGAYTIVKRLALKEKMPEKSGGWELIKHKMGIYLYQQYMMISNKSIFNIINAVGILDAFDAKDTTKE